MSGVKGRSGRRPLSVEMKRLTIIDKAWRLTDEKLESKAPDRYETAKDMVLKDMVIHVNQHIQAEIKQESPFISEIDAILLGRQVNK